MPYWKIYYHITWATKGRRALILPSFEHRIFQWIRDKAEALEAYVFAINGVEDHVHTVAAVPPKIALSQFIGQLKGSSARRANERLELDFTFAWQAEYGVHSFSEKELTPIIRYVNFQKRHHLQRSSLSVEFEHRSTDDAPFRPHPGRPKL